MEMREAVADPHDGKRVVCSEATPASLYSEAIIPKLP